MNRVARDLIASICIVGFPSIAVAQDLAAKSADLRIGMTADEVSKRLGGQKPERVVRQIIYRRHLEQWYYDSGNIRLEFDCRAAEEPRLTSILQMVQRPKP